MLFYAGLWLRLGALGSSLQETLTQYAQGSMTGAEVMPALQKSLGDFSTLAKMQKTPVGAFAGMFLEQAKKSAETAAESPLIAEDFERGMEENLGVEKGDVVESEKKATFGENMEVADRAFLNENEVIDWKKYVRNEGGFIPETKKDNYVLNTGVYIDRYGGEIGSFVSPAGTPFEARSLPYKKDNRFYHKYRVIKPIEGVICGNAEPAFGQPGQGIQYRLPYTVKYLLKNGYLEEVF